MAQLADLPNIGKTLSEKLNAVGIISIEQLKTTGSKQTIIKISALENSGVCINMLFALEGAIQGVRWHSLSKETKEELKTFYRKINLY